MEYLKLFNVHDKYEEYVSEGVLCPNISYCIDENKVHYNPCEIIVKFNVTDISNPIKIINDAKLVKYIKIDGVRLSNITTSHTFTDIGEYVLTYRFKDYKAIAASAFTNCNEIVDVFIPKGVDAINSLAFVNCKNLTSVTISNTVTKIVYRTFESCSALVEVNIPDSVVTIGRRSFYGCSNLSKVTIGKGLREATGANGVFGVCTSLTSVTIDEGIEIIGDDMFRGCSALPNITLPSTVTEIKAAAFAGCTSLSEITVKAVEPPALPSSNTFYGIDNLTIYVPAESVDKYKDVAYWRKDHTILPITE